MKTIREQIDLLTYLNKSKMKRRRKVERLANKARARAMCEGAQNSVGRPRRLVTVPSSARPPLRMLDLDTLSDALGVQHDVVRVYAFEGRCASFGGLQCDLMSRFILENPAVTTLEIEVIATKFTPPEKTGAAAGATNAAEGENYGLGKSEMAAEIASELRKAEERESVLGGLSSIRRSSTAIRKKIDWGSRLERDPHLESTKRIRRNITEARETKKPLVLGKIVLDVSKLMRSPTVTFRAHPLDQSHLLKEKDEDFGSRRSMAAYGGCSAFRTPDLHINLSEDSHFVQPNTVLHLPTVFACDPGNADILLERARKKKEDFLRSRVGTKVAEQYIGHMGSSD